MKIIAIHGIRRRHRWYNNLKNSSVWKENGVEVIPFEYGYFDLVHFLLPSYRQKIYDKFNDFYAEHIKADDTPPSVVCHSFGTMILYQAIIKYDSIKFNDVILCGSIIDQHVDWKLIYEKKQVQRVYNQCGLLDNIVTYPERILIKDSGKSGKNGFKNVPQEYIENRSFIEEKRKMSHSDFFNSTHMKATWEPFLLEGLNPFHYKRDILRNEIIDRVYKNYIDQNFTTFKATFHARVNFIDKSNSGHYYANYFFECFNSSNRALLSLIIKTSADSLDSAHNMDFCSYLNEQKLDFEVIGNSNQYKDFKLFFKTGVPALTTFTLNYKFMWKATISSSGETDHFVIRNCRYVHVEINFNALLKSPTFYVVKNNRIVDEVMSESRKLLDGTHTYYVDFENINKYDGLIFYFEGINFDYGKNITPTHI